MTRKDFELIANSIELINRQYVAEIDNPDNTAEERAFFIGARRGIQLAANNLASRLSISNPRFDGKRFLAACGVEHDPVFLVFAANN